MDKLSGGKSAIILIAVIAVAVLAFYSINQKKTGNNPPKIAEAEMYVCGSNKSITAVWRPEDASRVSLRLSHSPRVSLSQAVSASGARYASADEKFTFWEKDGEASITENGKITYSDCRMLEFAEE